MVQPHGMTAISRPSNVRWKILILICAASFASYVLRTNVSIVGETMIREIGLTQIQLGFIFSAFAWGYALFQFPGGIFGDVVGFRKAMSWIAYIWGALTLLTGLVPGASFVSPFVTLVILVTLRFLVGVSHAPIFPVICGAIANWFPVSHWGLPNGLSSSALTLGAAAAAPLIVWIMEIAGWRQTFFLTAPLGLVIGIVWWWYVRDVPAEHPKVNREELELIENDRPEALCSKEKGAWKLTIRNREILLLTASYFCMNYVFYLFFNWFFFYLIEVRNVTEQQAGLFTSAQWIAGTIGATAGGFLCDRFAKQFGSRIGYRLIPIPCLLASGILLLGGAYSSHPYIAVVMLSISFGFTQLTEGSYWAAIASVSGRHSCSAGGVMNTGGNAIGGIGAIVVPITAELFGWPAAVSTGCIFAVIGALLWCFIRADRPMVAVSNPKVQTGQLRIQ